MTVLAPSFSSAFKREIVGPIPSIYPSAVTTLGLDYQMSLTASELQSVRDCVAKLPLPWFEASEKYDFHVQNLAFSYIKQIDGPFVGNFLIAGNGAVLSVYPDNNREFTAGWEDFRTIAEAVAEIWAFVEWSLSDWNLRINSGHIRF